MWVGKPLVMKCQPGKPHFKKRIQFPAIAQRKADGVRIVIVITNDGISLVSQNGFQFLKLTSREEEFRRVSGEIVLDGELEFLSTSGKKLPRKASSGLANKSIHNTISKEEAERAIITIWDAIPYEMWNKGYCPISTDKRLRTAITAVHTINSSHISMIESWIVSSWEDAQEKYEEMRAIGEEGIIVKNVDAPWKFHRSPNCVKLKAEDPIDLRVINIKEGTGKNAGMMGALHCISDDGRIDVWVGSGVSDEVRQEVWDNWPKYFRKIVELKYNEVIHDKTKPEGFYSLFIPVFAGEPGEILWRFDKDETTTLEEVL